MRQRCEHRGGLFRRPLAADRTGAQSIADQPEYEASAAERLRFRLTACAACIQKRARTRAKLLEVARILVEEKGYEHTTLQEVARRAGMSNGAIYGNFRNRAELFAALGPTYWPRVEPNVAPGSSIAEIMRAVAEALIAALPARERVGAGRLRGLAYTLTNSDLKARASEIAAERYAVAAAWWREMIRDETDLPMPVEEWVRVINALTEGLTLQRMLTPELIPDGAIYAAFAALAPERPK